LQDDESSVFPLLPDACTGTVSSGGWRKWQAQTICIQAILTSSGKASFFIRQRRESQNASARKAEPQTAGA